MGLFITSKSRIARPADPESLFRDLRTRSSDIPHLWSHQADLLRSYNNNTEHRSNVAIELPTGAGKTLVGLLLAEFRRHSHGERAAYLCPTRQLAKQVGNQAKQYGIDVSVLIGPQRGYPEKAISDYKSGQTIAVTTYSGVFNSKPRIDDAQILILDDAHAAENYIASMWSLEIRRDVDEDLFEETIILLREGLPDFFYEDVSSGVGDRTKGLNDTTELVSGQQIRKCEDNLRGLFNDRLKPRSSPWFVWNLLKGNIKACCVFVSYDMVLIRPFIPPTLSHNAFANASRRVYMSATLGAGGELERITGIKPIKRLPIPAGWAGRGTGRRLFLLPQLAMDNSDAKKVMHEAIRDFPRCLVLAPTSYDAQAIEESLEATDRTILKASHIEDDLQSFTSEERTVLILSRYDGLDLPDDSCRLLIMAGLPSGTNLQEEFLWSRMSAQTLLRDRVLTRFTQGVGRCTRSDNDFALILLWDRSLQDYILRQDNRCLLNAELQAELELGIDNSDGGSDFKSLWRSFKERDRNWEEAEQSIVEKREQKKQQTDGVSVRLQEIVSHEIAYQYALWNGEYESASILARKAADGLSGIGTKGYQGWWYYLVADALIAQFEKNGNPELIDSAREFIKRAGQQCIGNSWLARITLEIQADSSTNISDGVTAKASENIGKLLRNWGIFGQRFEGKVNEARSHIQDCKHTCFQQGLSSLGMMLGFEASIPNEAGAPDCVWSIENKVFIVHEAKSEQSKDGEIGKKDILQAQGHENWIRSKFSCEERTVILPVIETPRTKVSNGATIHATSVCHITLEKIVSQFERISSILTRIRMASSSNANVEEIQEKIVQEITKEKLTPLDVLKVFSKTPIRSL